jgi:hypothetical protein
VHFDWLSFIAGGIVGVWILSMWQKRVDRLRWNTLRRAIDAGITIGQYAKDLESAEGGNSKK